jgi:hypothetical protein
MVVPMSVPQFIGTADGMDALTDGDQGHALSVEQTRHGDDLNRSASSIELPNNAG